VRPSLHRRAAAPALCTPERNTFFFDQIKTPIGDMILIADGDGAL
jgi:hypothetical protein